MYIFSDKFFACSLSAILLFIFQGAPAFETINGDLAKWTPAQDESKVQRIGSWQETSFRYAAKYHLFTSEDGAALEFAFDGTCIAIRLGAHSVPAYGAPNSGSLLITIPRLLKNNKKFEAILVEK